MHEASRARHERRCPTTCCCQIAYMAMPCAKHICGGSGGGGVTGHATELLVTAAALSITSACLDAIAAGCVATAAAMRQGDAEAKVQMAVEASVVGTCFVCPSGYCCGDGTISSLFHWKRLCLKGY